MSNIQTSSLGAADGPGTTVDPVDEILPVGQLSVLGLQHVLVMYAGAVAVPLIIGGALKLPKDQVALLINADLLCAGIVTLIQSIGFWKFGIREWSSGISHLFCISWVSCQPFDITIRS